MTEIGERGEEGRRAALTAEVLDILEKDKKEYQGLFEDICEQISADWGIHKNHLVFETREDVIEYNVPRDNAGRQYMLDVFLQPRNSDKRLFMVGVVAGWHYLKRGETIGGSTHFEISRQQVEEGLLRIKKEFSA